MTQTTKTITFDNINTCVPIDAFDRSVKDTIFNTRLLLHKLDEKKKMYDGGLLITEPIMNGEGTVSTYTPNETLDVEDAAIVSTAKYTRALYRGSIMITDDEFDNQGSDNQIIDLLQLKYDNIIMSLEKHMTTALFGDGTVATYGSNCLVGLAKAVAETNDSGFYAGFDRALETGWQNQALNMTTLATLTMLKLQNLWSSCTDGKIHPDIGVTTDLVYNKIWSLADDKQQLGNEEAARLGFASIDFNRVAAIVVDKACTADNFYWLNTDFLYFKVQEGRDFTATPFLQPAKQLIKIKHVTWKGQLVCSNPRYQGLGFNIGT